jgi:hypothetical protein
LKIGQSHGAEDWEKRKAAVRILVDLNSWKNSSKVALCKTFSRKSLKVSFIDFSRISFFDGT